MASLRSCLKFLAILKRLNFQEPVSGFCLPIEGYFGSFLRFSRPIAWLSSFEKRRKIPRNFLPMPQTNKFKQLLSIFHLRAMIFFAKENRFIPKRSLDFGEIARLCHAACFWPSRRRSGLRRGVARNRMRTKAGKMPESLIFPIRNGHGVSNDRFGFIGDTKGWCNVGSVYRYPGTTTPLRIFGFGSAVP